MTMDELQFMLDCNLPFVKLEEKNNDNQCKYMIGTQSGMLMIKSNSIMIRVGGGYATLEKHLE